MQMTNDEICASYRDAKEQKKQVSILADLNACPKTKIREILRAGGYDVPEPGRKPAKKAGTPAKTVGKAAKAVMPSAELPGALPEEDLCVTLNAVCLAQEAVQNRITAAKLEQDRLQQQAAELTALADKLAGMIERGA